MSAFFEQMAKQIAKIFLPGLDVNTPVVTMLFWTQSTPGVAHPSPLKKNSREGHLVVKNGTMLHELNSMGALVSSKPKFICQAFCFHAFSEDEVGFCLWYIEFLAKFLEFFLGFA